MVTRADLRRSRIDPRQPRFRAMLDGLQANILKAGGRDHAVYLCFRVRPGMADRARRWIRDFATRRMTSAREQLAEAAAHRRRKAAGRPIVNFFLSAKGYRALGARLELPGDPRFRAGMKRARARLKDPPPAAWEHGYRGDVHAAILLNDARAARLARQAERVRRELGGFATVLTVERGRVWRDARHEPIEHFGYVDGRSQPLFLKPDIDKEKKREGIGRWNPSAPLDLVLARDPNVAGADAFGSYAVFRKLEQNVRAFKTLEDELAQALGLTDEEQGERAGALAVGRFEDGTPVALSEAAGRYPPPNNFNYSRDPMGGRCPLHAHIRAVNPRTEASRAHRLVRRGIPYGERAKPPDADQLPRQMPTRGVGLLFLCFQRNIGTQFEHAQKAANAARAGAMDPILGQGPLKKVPRWPRQWNRSPSDRDRFDFRVPVKANGRAGRKGVVTLKGGEYFFAPSLPFLRSL